MLTREENETLTRRADCGQSTFSPMARLEIVLLPPSFDPGYGAANYMALLMGSGLGSERADPSVPQPP
jgi:hypothetical protein